MKHAREEMDQQNVIVEGRIGVVSTSNPGSHDMEHGVDRSDKKVPAVRGWVVSTTVVELCCQIGPAKDRIASSVILVRMRLKICGCL